MYINFVKVENKNKYITLWLLLITLLVAIIIIIGGLTRLTDSGLSITKWDLFVGIVPPLSQSDWNNLFLLYQKIPEFKIQNSTMTLQEFKLIFWWEYAHRLIGRILGLTFIFPLIYFTWKKLIPKKYLLSLYFIFFLILIQGVVGWYMVKSGLTERTDVSHFRLSLHLTIAFIIFILLLLNFFKYTNRTNLTHFQKIPYNLPVLFLLLILIQVSIGAFVSGLDAGQIYQSWPLMNRAFFPDDSSVADLFKKDVFSIPSLVQFLHRNIAYLIFIFFLFICFIVFKNNELFYLKKYIIIIFASLLLQIFLGILTVLSGAQIFIASMHQVGSLLLVFTSVLLISKNSKTN